jgi:carbon storage regulator
MEEPLMLVLTRKMNEQIVIKIGEQTVVVRVLEAHGDRVRLGIIAPESVAIHREEVARRLQEFDQHFLEPAAQSSRQAPPIAT